MLLQVDFLGHLTYNVLLVPCTLIFLLSLKKGIFPWISLVKVCQIPSTPAQT